MKVLAEYKYKNVLCQVVGRKQSEDNVYLKENGDFYIGTPARYAEDMAIFLYQRTHHNRRAKKITVIKERLTPSFEKARKRFVSEQDAWVEREYRKRGPANNAYSELLLQGLSQQAKNN